MYLSISLQQKSGGGILTKILTDSEGNWDGHGQIWTLLWIRIFLQDPDLVDPEFFTGSGCENS
jgi:hypothetical protein